MTTTTLFSIIVGSFVGAALIDLARYWYANRQNKNTKRGTCPACLTDFCYDCAGDCACDDNNHFKQ